MSSFSKLLQLGFPFNTSSGKFDNIKIQDHLNSYNTLNTSLVLNPLISIKLVIIYAALLKALSLNTPTLLTVN